VRPRPEDCPVPFLWKILDRAGTRCIVMDAFLTCPLAQFEGVQIVDWGSWTHFAATTIAPESVKRSIQQQFGDYPAEDHSQVGMTPPPDPAGFRQRLLGAVQHKTRVLRWLMANEAWDLLLVVFGECHPAGHYFWHFQDESYVAYPERCERELRNALRDVYVALDEAIGELIAVAGSDTMVFVVSGDGMGPNYSGSHILNDLLTRMRLMNEPARQEADPAGAQDAGRAARRGLLSRLRGMVPQEFRAAISRHLLPRWVNERLSLHWKTADIDWARTRAFLIENANEGYVRINLKGREPQGIVARGGEYERLCATLADAARSLKNPANGRPAACAVHRTDEIFAGPCRPMMPDVIINWEPDARVTTELATQNYGVARAAQPGYAMSPYYSGNHRPNAFMVAAGPGMRSGAVMEDASVLDLAPTILAHFGIAPAPHMPGRVLPLAESVDG
ncbi:MAG: alkaline phosphatase family protein, partial [Steroidobacteraceae bacterium]